MRISIKLGAKVITASLADSATSRDFISLLPMTITSSRTTQQPKRSATCRENYPPLFYR